MGRHRDACTRPGLDQVQAVEEPQDLSVVAGLEIGAGAGVALPARDDLRGLPADAAMAGHGMAARREHITEPGDQAGAVVRVAG